jgi:hypothetical protein
MDRGPRRVIVGLALFRVFVGACLLAEPWLVGNGLDGYGAVTIGCGVAMIAAATQMHRAPWLRWVQAALAMVVFFVPFAFPTDDINDREVYYSAMVGFMMLVTAIVSPRWFAQDESERTSASEAARSSGSNTSSVSTPSN